MIDYALAKELEDAGFPHDGAGYREIMPGALNATDHNTAYVPTLSELIGACGAEFVCVRNWQREQERYGNKPDDTDHPYIAESTRVSYGDEGTNSWVSAAGSTPEEAVARLWLALNKPA